MELFTSTNEATLIKLSKCVAQLLCKSFLCRMVFQIIETNYNPICMKINHIFFVIKGLFPVMDYISNKIILYFIVPYLCSMSILLHNMYASITYATREWPEMYSYQ